MIRNSKGVLTPKVETFLAHVREGASFKAAATAAGFKNPVQMARTLVRDAEVMDRMLTDWQALGLTWRRLKGKSMAALDRALSRKILNAATGEWLDNTEYDPKLALRAADAVLSALLKMGDRSLEEEATREDQRTESREEMARRLLGEEPDGDSDPPN